MNIAPAPSKKNKKRQPEPLIIPTSNVDIQATNNRRERETSIEETTCSVSGRSKPQRAHSHPRRAETDIYARGMDGSLDSNAAENNILL